MAEYTYKGLTFKSKQNNLKLYRILFPLIEEYNKAKIEAYKAVDRSVVMDYEKRINKLKLQISRNTERKEPTEDLIKQLDDLQLDYVSDPLVKETNEYLSSIQTNIHAKLVYNEELIRQVANELVEGDTSVFDFEDNEFYFFIGKIINDFFLTMRNSKAT